MTSAAHRPTATSDAPQAHHVTLKTTLDNPKHAITLLTAQYR
jgi:hypothetical protein